MWLQRERVTCSHGLKIMIRAVAARVASDLGSDSSPPKLSELKRTRDGGLMERYSSDLVDRQPSEKDATFNSEGPNTEGAKW